jgi:hypothetical protein
LSNLPTKEQYLEAFRAWQYPHYPVN